MPSYQISSSYIFPQHIAEQERWAYKPTQPKVVPVGKNSFDADSLFNGIKLFNYFNLLKKPHNKDSPSLKPRSERFLPKLSQLWHNFKFTLSKPDSSKVQ